MPRLRGAALALILVLLVPGTAGAEAPLAKPDPIALPHVPGVVLVGFAPGATADQKAAARARVGATARPISPLARDAERWDLPRGLSTEAAMAALANVRALRYAEPNYLLTTADTSNDPSFTNGSLWGMYGATTTPANQYGSNAAAAWSRGYIGSSDVYVGIIDTGVQFDHPDLADNFWTNAAEAAGTPGADDDGNGYIDDLHGWDFVRNDNTVFDSDEHYHGTHVAGTIGGVGGNATGVVGVNWRVKMISGKFLGSGGSGTTDAAAAAIDYMTQLKVVDGLNIVATSNSWGGGGYNQTLVDAITRGGDQGILFVAAAGNGYSDNDAITNYPSNYTCTTKADGSPRGYDCVVAVAAITSTGAKADFSNWGLTTVDIGAPGYSVYSTYPVSTYGTLSGTSMATPHVSGAVALCKSVTPAITASQIRLALLNSSAPTPSLAGLTVSGGRLDVNALVDACLPPAAGPTGTVSNVTVGAATISTLAVSWTSDATGQAWFDIARAPYTSGVCGSYTIAATAGAASRSAVLGGLIPSTSYCIRIRASNSYLGGSSTSWSSPTTGRTVDPPTPYVCSATPFAWVDPTIGTNLGLSDDSTYALNLPAGFAFSYYGVPVTAVTVSSNGFVRAGTTAGSYYTNGPIPAIAEPNGIMAAAWDDWNPSAGGTVSYRVEGSSPSRRFVVTWWNVPHYNVTGSAVSFQAILEEGSGVVRYQYLDMVTGASSYDFGGTATSGIESQTGEFGTQVSYNTRTILDGTAVRCAQSAPLAPVIDTASLPDGTTGAFYSTTLAASGGVGPYAWSLTAGSLPGGLSLTGSTIAGTPTTVESQTFTVKAVGGDGGTSSRTLSIAVAAPVAVTTASLVTGTTGTPYSATLAASGGTTPYGWTLASGTLPTSLALSSGGVISGTPSVAGSYSFTVKATDGSGRTATSGLSMIVYDPLAIGTASLPGTETGVSYSATLAATGAVGPYTWSLASGTLPAGLTISADGVIAGSPTGAGTSSFSVRASSPNGMTATRALSIAVVAPLAVSTASLAGGTGGASYSASLGATGGSGGYAWSATGLPAGLAISGSTITGTPTASGTYTVDVTVTDGGGRTATRTLSLGLAFGKRSPAAATKFANTVRSVTLAWSAHAGVASYQWCATKTSKCTNWTAAGANTSAALTVAPGETWTWQVQALVGSTWTNANGNSSWKFSVNR